MFLCKGPVTVPRTSHAAEGQDLIKITLRYSNVAMENSPFRDDFLIETSIY